MQLPDEIHRNQISNLMTSRLAGVPLAYITGHFTFMELEMLAGPEACIPRRETEVTGAAALQLLWKLAEARGSVRVLDVCTGSGNLGLALAFYEPRSRVYGVDVHAPALHLARRNAVHLGVAERAQFLQGDLFTPLELAEFWNGFDLVVSNPPYVPSHRVKKAAFEVAGFEPQPAYDGGVSGLEMIERLVYEAPRFLKAGGSLCVEVGLGQGEIAAHMARHTCAYVRIQTVQDSEAQTRAIIATTGI